MSSLKAFLRDYPQYDYSILEIEQHYTDWVSDVRYMILSKWNDWKMKNEVFAVKCAKRGNDVYRFRVNRRFKDLCAMVDDLYFFNSKERGIKKTRALWATLTYDSKRCSYEQAWRNIGIEFNRFMSFIRKKFGKVSCCRVFESFENGYPHIHCILLFEKTWFKVFRDQKNQFRIQDKGDFEGGWHSNIDVKAMSSLASGFSYLKKYLLKGIDYEKADSKAKKTLSLTWAFQKRAFSVSGRFRKLLIDLINKLKNLKQKRCQVTLLGEKVPEQKYYVLGFVSAEVLAFKRDMWFSQLDSERIALIQPFLDDQRFH